MLESVWGSRNISVRTVKIERRLENVERPQGLRTGCPGRVSNQATHPDGDRSSGETCDGRDRQGDRRGSRYSIA